MALVAVWVCTIATPAFPAEEISREYKIKAVFLYHFLNFVEWPHAEDKPNETGHLMPEICIAGGNPFGDALEYIREKNETRDPFWLSYPDLAKPNAFDRCRILFLSKNIEKDIAPLLVRVADRPILTVSDVEGFADHGGMVEMFEEDNKVRLRINAKRFEKAGFRSAELMRLAEVVE